MKVLHVIPSVSASDGGPSHAMALMERALAAQGIDVETATTDHEGPGLRNGKPCGVPLEENGVVRRYFPKVMDFYKPSPAFGRWIDTHVESYDIVHIHALFSFTSSAAARAARRAGVPYVVRPLGVLNAYGLRQHKRWLKWLSIRLIEAPILRNAAAVHFTSEDEAVQARLMGIPLREAIIPLAVELAFDGAAARPVLGGSPSLLFLSRLDPKKNVEGLLDAFAGLRQSVPRARLVVAGDGPPAYLARLQARATSLRIAEAVEWPGHVSGETKARALRNADIFVLPSFSENFGIAAAEALACGLPVVLGEGVAIAGEVAQAGAGLAVKPTPEGIADGLRRIIGDDTGRQAMALRARALAQRQYSAQAMGARLKQLYSDILNPRP
jgi:glycosyltransferase involved in cell wall biosynthesis